MKENIYSNWIAFCFINSMLRLFGFALTITILFTSCQSYNSVVSNNKLIQKRKYTSGWFVKKNIKQKGEDECPSIASGEENNSKHKLIINENQEIAANLIITNEIQEEYLLEPVESITDNPLQREQYIENSELKKSVEKKKDEPVEVAAETEEETNKVAVGSFVLMLLGALFLGIGFAIYTVSEAYLLLIVGFVLIGLSLILAILALTKYKHIEKRKKLAKITLYSLILGPIVTFFVTAIVGVIWLVSGGSFY